jgi:uncharacterized membrane protein YdjX (TVP38/TMEM64 family)
VGFPVTALIATVGALFGLGPTLLIAGGGIAASAMIGLGLGRVMPAEKLRALGAKAGGGAGSGGSAGRSSRWSRRLATIRERLSGRGLLAVAVLRNVPVAPFAVMNIACGVTSVSWRAYLAGTLLGMAPGVVLLAIFGAELGDVLRNPTPKNVAVTLGALAAVVVTAMVAERVIRRTGAAGGASTRSNTDAAAHSSRAET